MEFDFDMQIIDFNVELEAIDQPDIGEIVSISPDGTNTASVTWEAVGPYTFVDVSAFADDYGAHSSGTIIASSDPLV